MSLRKATSQNGFTLLEVMVAMMILAIGILAVAAMMSQLGAGTSESRYLSSESLLASQKLEDLNRYPSNDQNVNCVNGAATCGSLTADVDGFSDQVEMSSGVGNANNGQNSDIVTNFKQSGNYTQILHSPNGTISSQKTNNATPQNPTPDMLVFDRRWLIETNTPAFGIRRITVVVSLLNAVNGPNGGQSSFQVTMVRP